MIFTRLFCTVISRLCNIVFDKFGIKQKTHHVSLETHESPLFLYFQKWVSLIISWVLTYHDIAMLNQLSIVLRYFRDSQAVERFIIFLELQHRTDEAMAQQVLKYLYDVCILDFAKCRGQSYVNAVNMLVTMAENSFGCKSFGNLCTPCSGITTFILTKYFGLLSN